MPFKTTTLGLFGAAVGALTALMTTTAHVNAATVAELDNVMQTQDYADLLAPVPNAVAILRADDLTSGSTQANDKNSDFQHAQ